LEHGKKVLVEWPLAATTDEIEELTELAKKSGVDTVVGVQARAAPIVVKLKEILASGQIGTVLSSTVVISWSKLQTETWLDSMKFYLDLNSGGNEFTIAFGHCKWRLIGACKPSLTE
jgi:predicted dehydrogenase